MPSFLKYCSDYTTLTTVTSLTKETEYDILCIVYMNNYVNLCNSLPTNNTVDDKQIENAANISNLEKTCEILSHTKLNEDFKDAASILSSFKTPDTCTVLCKELTVSKVTPICSLAAFTLSYAHQIQQNLTKVQPRVKPQNDVENVDHTKLFNKVNQASPVAKPNITKNNGEIPDKEILAQNQQKVQNADQDALPVDPPKKVADDPKKNQDAPHPMEDPQIMPFNQIQLWLKIKDGGSTDNAVQSNSVVAQDENTPLEVSNGKGESNHDDNVPVGPSTEITSTKMSDVKKDNVDEALENQQVQPQLIKGNENPPQEEQSDQKSSPQDEADSPAVQNAKPVDSTDVKESILSPAVQNAKPVDSTDVKESILSEGALDEAGPNQENDMIDEDDLVSEPEKSSSKIKQQPKPQETDEDVLIPPYNSSNSDEEDSFFFIYFMMVCAVFILGYLGYHNKQKVLALVIEGRRGRRGSRRGRPLRPCVFVFRF
ncbi:hypothetical protein QE152_g725 [Popillia japonica]|uniref:Trans-Golgi network integral membrane protein 2 n=1 Tax=Popillia japonica TaxID=7064 RepID=A0AAW1NJ73_POPJA